MMKRDDDYPRRRAGLVHLSDEALEQRFWELAEQVTAPLVELARTHTSPSIERSVLLRMGFSGPEAQALVKLCAKHGLLGRGAGHVVLRYARHQNLPLREAGLLLAAGGGWDQAAALFREAVTV